MDLGIKTHGNYILKKDINGKCHMITSPPGVQEKTLHSATGMRLCQACLHFHHRFVGEQTRDGLKPPRGAKKQAAHL